MSNSVNTENINRDDISTNKEVTKTENVGNLIEPGTVKILAADQFDPALLVDAKFYQFGKFLIVALNNGKVLIVQQ